MDTQFKQILRALVMLLLFGNLTAQGSSQDTLDLHQQALDQTDEIDLIYELLAEATNKGNLNQKRKQECRDKFGKIRNIISTVKDTPAANLPKILSTNEVMMQSLEFMANHNFQLIPTITGPMILRRSKSLSTSEAQKKLLVTKKKLVAIQKNFKNIGMSGLNMVVRRSEKIIKKFKVHKVVPRLTPYTLILLYMMYVTRLENLKPIEKYIPRPLSSLVTAIKNLMGTAPFVRQESSTAKEVQDRSQYEPGPLSSLQALLQGGNFLKIDIEPIIRWAPATFLLGLISKDVTDLAKAIKKKTKNIYSKLKNEKIYDESAFSKPDLSADSLDILEIFEFRNLENYFKYKKLFNLAKHAVDKAYLFIGSQETGHYMVDTLCAQLCKDLNSDCRLVRLNASDFVSSPKIDKDDKLSKILSDAKKHDINFILIHDIDWIYKQKELSIARLDKFLDDVSKKSNIILVGLTDRPDAVRLGAKNNLAKLTINNPNYEQRIKFIKAQLRAGHTIQEIDIEDIAKRTENYTLGELKKLVQTAYTLSYAEHKPFNKKYLVLSADQMPKKAIE